MKINIAKSAGFCFGVKRALSIALKTASLGSSVYMLGDIVHNEDVVKYINKAGIKKINRLSYGKGQILLIRAHGACKEVIHKANRLGYKVVDATCPMVKEIHKIAQVMEKKGYKIIVIGDRGHDEVHGITGQLKGKAIIIDDVKRIPFAKLKRAGKTAVLVQSTQNLEKVIKIVAAIKPNIRELKFCNTICQPTRIKQQEIKRMPLENDVMIIIGSRTSANTKRLYEISKSLNQRTYWVSSKRDIRRNWFKDAKTVGVTAGASTPDSTTQDVVKYLKILSQPFPESQ
jgi:4-hydroxy-3-methylbut-2-enyl diphosphate reductase